MQLYTNRELIRDLKDPHRADIASRYLMQCSPNVFDLARRYRLSGDDAKDLFQDAMLAFIERVAGDRFDPEGSASAAVYLYGIAFHLLKKRYNRRMKQEEWEREFAETYLVTEKIVQNYDNRLTAHALLDQLGSPCQELLTAYYLNDREIEDLSKDYEEVAIGTLQQRIRRCMQKLKTYSKKWADNNR